MNSRLSFRPQLSQIPPTSYWMFPRCNVSRLPFDFSPEEEVQVVPLNENNKDPNWGTTRSLISNSINGVTEGFSKTLELNGTGYRASVSGSKLKLELGYSHDINFEIPTDVKIECPKQNLIKLTSINKEKLGAAAAKIRSFRKPEPFKGKGIKYIDEYIFRKEGKKK
mgnify:CR=1 FL=1